MKTLCCLSLQAQISRRFFKTGSPILVFFIGQFFFLSCVLRLEDAVKILVHHLKSHLHGTPSALSPTCSNLAASPVHQALETMPGKVVQPVQISGTALIVHVLNAFVPVRTGCSPNGLPTSEMLRLLLSQSPPNLSLIQKFKAKV